MPRTPLLFKFPAFLGARLKATETGLLFFFFFGTPVLTHGRQGRPGDSGNTARSAPETVVTVIAVPAVCTSPSLSLQAGFSFLF